MNVKSNVNRHNKMLFCYYMSPHKRIYKNAYMFLRYVDRGHCQNHEAHA
jgi:hypothetical protein